MMTLWMLDATAILAAEDRDDEQHDGAVRVMEVVDPPTTLDVAYFEVANAVIVAWHNHEAATRPIQRIDAIAADHSLVRVDSQLIRDAQVIASDHGVSVYDAS